MPEAKPSALSRAGYPDIALPTLSHIAPGYALGRNPLEGYQRSVSINEKHIAEVRRHPLFQEAKSAALGRTLIGEQKLLNIFLIMSLWFDQFDNKNCIEFGTYRGGSTFFMATILARLYHGAQIYALDTFEGMPAVDSTLDAHRKGDFGDVSLPEIESAAASLKLDNVVFVKGLVEDTFPAKIPRTMRFGLAHIDTDIYSAIRHCQDQVWDWLEPRGYIVFDDATAPSCLGATQAVEELVRERGVHSEQIYPHFVFRHKP